jgi:hypothetical protein
MKYEGLRFRAECRLAGKLYGQAFGVDVAFGDPVLGEPETVTTDDVLAFAGITPPVLRLYPVETHIAEKLHAYTMPRAHPNTRVKDLPDIALLATTGPLNATRVRLALERTFEFRATHPLPPSLPNPPALWSAPYREMARENELAWTTIEQLTTESVWITTITLFEARLGLALLPNGRRRQALEMAFEQLLAEDLEERYWILTAQQPKLLRVSRPKDNAMAEPSTCATRRSPQLQSPAVRRWQPETSNTLQS